MKKISYQMMLSNLENGSFINKTHGGRNKFYLNLIRINKECCH
jgi:hypothetical protein